MEMLLYQSTQFRDVKKILDRAHGFAGLLTAGGIEASRQDVPFVCDQKVVSLSLFRRFGQILYTVYIVYSLDSSFLLW